MKNKIILASVISVAAVLTAVVLLLLLIPKTFYDRMEKADKKLSKDPYTIDVKISFNCYDDEISGIFSEISNSKTKVYVDNDRYQVENTVEINLAEDDGKKTDLFTNNFTVTGDRVYAYSDYTVNGEGGNPHKNYAAINGDEARDLLEKSCLIGGISADRFSTFTDGKEEKAHVAVFSGISDSDRAVLEEMLSAQLEDAAESVSLKDARLTVKIVNGRYDIATLEAEYDVVIKGKTYSVDASVELKFDYDAENVYPPDSVDEYQENELDKIIG